MSVIITGMDMQQDCMKCPLDNWLTCKVSGKLCKKSERPEHCTLKSVEELIEKLEKEKMLHTGTFEDDNPIDYGMRSGLSKAIKMIKQYCDMEVKDASSD